MLHERLELQQILLVFRVVLGSQWLSASESANAALRIPVRYGQEVGRLAIVAAQPLDYQAPIGSLGWRAAQESAHRHQL
jgi:hypothetical protein